MDEDEAAQRAAEHKAAALHHVGWETGAGAAIWARAVQDELERHEAAREQFGANKVGRQTWERLYGTALMLVLAIDQVLAFAGRVGRLTDDAELAEARARFDAVCRNAKLLRNLVAHLDSYAVGEGRHQTGQGGPSISEKYVAAEIWWGDGGGTILRLGSEQLNLRAAANVAISLARVVERVRAEHLGRVEQEANAAVRRRWGIAPE